MFQIFRTFHDQGQGVIMCLYPKDLWLSDYIESRRHHGAVQAHHLPVRHGTIPSTDHTSARDQARSVHSFSDSGGLGRAIGARVHRYSIAQVAIDDIEERINAMAEMLLKDDKSVDKNSLMMFVQGSVVPQVRILNRHCFARPPLQSALLFL
jgi:hypothetical protein